MTRKKPPAASSESHSQELGRNLAMQYRKKLQRFFVRPSQTIDLHSLADYLESAVTNRKKQHILPAKERLETLLASVNFVNLAPPQDNYNCTPAPENYRTGDFNDFSLPAIDQMLEQCEKRNEVTIRLMSILGNPA